MKWFFVEFYNWTNSDSLYMLNYAILTSTVSYILSTDSSVQHLGITVASLISLSLIVCLATVMYNSTTAIRSVCMPVVMNASNIEPTIPLSKFPTDNNFETMGDEKSSHICREVTVSQLLHSGPLGLAGFPDTPSTSSLRLQEYAEIAAPLTDLTRKNAPNHVQWTAECDSAFNRLKDCLCCEPILRSPDFSLPFVLQTDASGRAIGAVLSQVGGDDEEHPVAYYSRKLLPREEKYSTVEKECLAIILGIQTFRVYLLGRPFVIQTVTGMAGSPQRE
ncbi:hypothetical protein EMCRGX_G003411 [Ephydatia muelleri]